MLNNMNILNTTKLYILLKNGLHGTLYVMCILPHTVGGKKDDWRVTLVKGKRKEED